MTGAQKRFVDDFGDARMNALPLIAQVPVEDRRQQWVGEVNRALATLDYTRGESRIERAGGNTRPLQERLRDRAQRGGERERLACGRREPGDSGTHKLLERLGNRKRLNWVDVRFENAGELEGEERIAARPLMDAKQCLAGEGAAEPVSQQPVKRTDAQRSDRQPLNRLRAERLLESRWLHAGAEPPGEQQAHIVRANPSQRKCERTRRRGVQPLEIVDRNEHRGVFGEQLQGAARSNAERPWIHCIRCRLVEKKRDLQRALSWCGQRREHLVEDVLEQIAKPDVREIALGLGRSGGENPLAQGARVLDACKPECRFPDPRFAFEHERGRRNLRFADEDLDRGKFVLPTDDLAGHPPTIADWRGPASVSATMSYASGRSAHRNRTKRREIWRFLKEQGLLPTKQPHARRRAWRKRS